MKKRRNQNWLKANHICLASGNSVARNLMFETRKDHKRFIKLWKKYLGNMADLNNYFLSPTGWTILFKTRKESEILQAYKAQRNKSKKAKSRQTLKDVSKILSEHFRIFLSQYVRRTNAYHQRSGTLVKKSFNKYVIHDGIDYERLFMMLTNQQRRKSQINKKYQADERGYDAMKQMKSESMWKVGRSRKRAFEIDASGFCVVSFVDAKNHVLRKYRRSFKPTKSNPPSP